jgi:glycosyltransferase involved in cell wall biosynthesis
MTTKVSVVIPTRNRPEIVKRAVQSAIAQTLQKIEVIVVIDGPDEMTGDTLGAIKDDRLKIIALKENVGGSEARNIGIRAAVGKWIALLDDDDEWLPEKLEAQLAMLDGHKDFEGIIACKYIERRVSGDMIRPSIMPQPYQHVSDYLFTETPWIRPRKGFLQTSTIMASNNFLKKTQFRQGLKRNQETDWLLRGIDDFYSQVLVCPRVLAIFHNETTTERVGSNLDWEYSFDWAVENRDFFTPSAFSMYLVTCCLPVLTQQRAPAVSILRIWKACWRYGMVDFKIVWFIFRYGFVVRYLRPLLPISAIGIFRRFAHR